MNEAFWKEIGISNREIDAINSSSYKKLQNILKTSSRDIDPFLAHFGLEAINLEDARQLKRLVSTEKGRAVIGLFKYQIGKIDQLKEYFRLMGQEVERVLPSLVSMYNAEKEKIIDSAYYYYFNNLEISEEWNVSPNLPDQFVNDFQTKELSIKQLVSRQLHRRTRLARSFKVGDITFFFFERAKKESVVQGFNERIPLLRRAAFGIAFDPSKNRITVRSADPRISNIFNSYLQKENLKVYMHKLSTSAQQPQDVSQNLLTYSGNRLVITEVDFHHLSRGLNCRTTFKNENGVGNLLQPLIEAGFIDPTDHGALKSFTIQLRSISKKIHLQHEDDKLSFNLARKGLVAERFQEIVTLLNSEFGISLDQEYPQAIESVNKRTLLQNMVGKYIHQLSPAEKTLGEELSSFGIMETQNISIKYCPGCGKVYENASSISVCEECQSSLSEAVPREKIAIDNKKALSYLVNRFKAIFGSENAKIAYMKNDNRPFISLQDGRSEIFLYPYFSGHVKKLIEKWNQEFIPSVQIIMGSHSPNLESELVSEIFFYDLLFQTDDELKNQIKSAAITKHEQVISRAASESIRRAKAILAGQLTVTGDEFDNICYPILKRILNTVVHWGTKQRFKSVPDGIYGIKMEPRNAFSLIYDCKYSSTTYDLDEAEKRKARDYCKRANQAKALKSFSKCLSAYVAITHNVSTTQFSNLAEYIKGYRKWKGKLVMLPLQQLVELYDNYASSYRSDAETRVAFNLGIRDQIKDAADRAIILSSADITAICNKANNLKGNLDVQSILKHMESNIEY